MPSRTEDIHKPYNALQTQRARDGGKMHAISNIRAKGGSVWLIVLDFRCQEEEAAATSKEPVVSPSL